MNLLKKISIVSALSMLMATGVSAAVVEFTVGDTNFAVDKEGEVAEMVLEAAPFIKDGRTMVPVRAISDAFGASTDWNGEKREVKITSGDKEILLTIDTPFVTLNGEKKTLDSSPVIVGERTFVPLRFISEELSYNVNYVNATKQVIIDNTDIAIKCGNEKISLAEVEALYRIMYDVTYPEKEAQNLTEEEFSAYMIRATLETLLNNVKMYNSFPSVGLTEEDCKEIKNVIATAKNDMSYRLDGMFALIFERQYFSQGNSIIAKIAEEEKDNFEEAYNNEYISAKHILVEDEDKANEIYKKLSDGADFDELVKEFGKDPGMESNPDGYVFTKGDMVIEFEEATYGLKEGEISKPVKSNYGYHIIMRTQLPEISDDVRNEMAVNKGNEIITLSENPELLIEEAELLKLINK